METRWLPASVLVWMITQAEALDARQRRRFVQIGGGLLFARGRRTVTSWLRACAAGRDYKRYYYLLGSVGRKAEAIAGRLLRILPGRLPAPRDGEPLVFAIDDSPTKRYGPHVAGAGRPHNPTPGPAGAKFLYGHVWVCLARLVRHPHWGPSRCRSSPGCTSVPRTSAGWRRTTGGSSAPSWSWPPQWSGGWPSDWAGTARRSGS